MEHCETCALASEQRKHKKAEAQQIEQFHDSKQSQQRQYQAPRQNHTAKRCNKHAGANRNISTKMSIKWAQHNNFCRFGHTMSWQVLTCWWSLEIAARHALAEVESLIDHLFQHPNTAPFISYRLIQRLVTSNPSRTYVKDVADAFKTGMYGGYLYRTRMHKICR